MSHPPESPPPPEVSETPNTPKTPPHTETLTPPPLRASAVVLVGHCGMDSGSLAHAATQASPGVEIHRVNRRAALEPLLGPGSLLLINRVLGRSLGVRDGVALVAELSALPEPPLMMLVSNYADAQAAAERAGALPGFGKSNLHSAQTTQRLAAALSGVPGFPG